MNAPVQARIDLPEDGSDTPTLVENPASNALGQSLAHLRTARGWTTAEVSVRLKFSERQIIALEAERWENLPKGLGLRGLIRNYARLLGADAEALLAALALQIGATPAGSKVGTPSSSPLASERAADLMSQESERSFPGAVVVGAIALVALAVIAAYALGWWPGGSGATPALPAAPVTPE